MFWLELIGGSSGANELTVSWNGAIVYDSRNTDFAAEPRTFLQVVIPNLAATSNATNLSFNVVSVSGNWDLDDVTVSASQ
jgi:hypothetical protein